MLSLLTSLNNKNPFLSSVNCYRAFLSDAVGEASISSEHCYQFARGFEFQRSRTLPDRNDQLSVHLKKGVQRNPVTVRQFHRTIFLIQSLLQSTSDNSNLKGKLRNVRVIGSSKKIAGSKVKNSFYCTVTI